MSYVVECTVFDEPIVINPHVRVIDYEPEERLARFRVSAANRDQAIRRADSACGEIDADQFAAVTAAVTGAAPSFYRYDHFRGEWAAADDLG